MDIVKGDQAESSPRQIQSCQDKQGICFHTAQTPIAVEEINPKTKWLN